MGNTGSMDVGDSACFALGSTFWILPKLEGKRMSMAAAAAAGAAMPSGRAGLRQSPDLAQLTAARLLEQATFGPTSAEIASLRRIGTTAWLQQQFALPASPIPTGPDLDAVRRNWYLNMANGQDQLRQRMVLALSQIFVIPADSNPCGDTIQPWLASLSEHAFGNYKTLLRDMTRAPTATSGTHARELMQAFTVGPVMLNRDGTVRLDRNGTPIPTHDDVLIGELSSALSDSACAGNDASLDAVLDMLFKHPNVPPFVATRLIRHFVTSNPSPAYVRRVAEVFAFGAGSRGERGDLTATLQAVLTDPEARYDSGAPAGGYLKDPILHTLSLVRALDGTLVNPDKLFRGHHLVGEARVNAASAHSHDSPASLVQALLSGDADMVRLDLAPFSAVAGNPAALLDLVDARLLQGRMQPTTRAAIEASLQSTPEPRQRMLTALYLTAVSADFAVTGCGGAKTRCRMG